MNYSIVKKEEIRILEVKAPLKKYIEGNFKTVAKLWQEAAKSGIIDKVISLMDKYSKRMLGVSVYMYTLDEWNYYIATKTDKKIAKGMDEYIIPTGTWAVFSEEGSMPTVIQEI